MTRTTRIPVRPATLKFITMTALPLVTALMVAPMLIGFASIRHPHHFAVNASRHISRNPNTPVDTPSPVLNSAFSTVAPASSSVSSSVPSSVPSSISSSVPSPVSSSPRTPTTAVPATCAVASDETRVQTILSSNQSSDNPSSDNPSSDRLSNRVSNRVSVGLANGDENGGKPGTNERLDGGSTKLKYAKNLKSGKRDRSGGSDADDAADNPTVDPVEDYKSAMALLKNHYYGETIDRKKSRQLTYEAIRGMVGGLKDRFSSFLDPDEWNQMQATTEGDFEGIGAVLARDNGRVRIVEPIETGPAAQAGMKADDIIVKVEGVSVIGQDLNEVVRRLKGKRGTRVHLTVQRGKQLIDLAILRSRVEPPVVKYWMEDPQTRVGRILLKEFNKRSIDQLNHAFTDLQTQGMRALILDLRFNPGGLLDSAIDVVSVFVPENYRPELHNVVVFMKEGSGTEQKRLLNPVETTYSKRVPIVLLVNENSASASEIVAGALKDYGVATLIGERTYGKGRVQTLIPLQDNSALRLTTQLYFPPLHKDLNFKRDEDGNRIPGTGGIIPDIEVHQSPKWHLEDWNDKGNDTQLHASLDFLRARLHGETLAQATQHVLQTH